MKLLEITDETIKFDLNSLVFETTYELVFSHSEGERTIDPQRDTYLEYYELELSDEALLDIHGVYMKWKPSERIYNIIKGWVKSHNYHVEVI